ETPAPRWALHRCVGAGCAKVGVRSRRTSRIRERPATHRMLRDMPRSRQTPLPSRGPRTVLTCLVLMLASIACAANSRTAPSDCGTLAVCCATRTGAAEQALCNSTIGAADATACARLLGQLCPGSVDASFLADSSAKDGTRKDSGGV